MTGVLYDTDFILALLVSHESTHRQAIRRYSSFAEAPSFVVRPVLYEAAAVSSRKYGHELAHSLMRSLLDHRFSILEIAEIENEGWQLYFSYSRKNISFVDCANLAAARRYDFKIASFDNFYPKDMLA